MYGINSDGKVYIHIKIYKQGRVFGETYHVDGTVLMRCRNCMRWHRVRIVNAVPKLEETETPVAATENRAG